MKLANGILTLALTSVCSGSLAWAQTASAPAKPDLTPLVRTFYLNYAMENDANTLQYALRTTLDQRDNIFVDTSHNAIVVRAINPDEFVLAQKIIDDLDRPRKTYRLTYTVAEVDGTKRIDTEHYAMVLAPGQRTELAESSKLPYPTGGYRSAGNNPVSTQYSFFDVGMTFDATVTELGKGVRLQSKVQQTSVVIPDQSHPEEKADAQLQSVRRESSLEGAAFLTAGKPLVLGSLDIPGSSRHLEVEVVMEEVR